MSPTMDFLNRNQEIDSLNDILARPGAQFLSVHGRRRIGKTALLSHWLEIQPSVPSAYWIAERGTASSLLAKFSRAVLPLLGHQDSEFSFSSWAAALEEIGRLSKQQRLILVIDELPYLVECVPSFPSLLQSHWDRVLQKGQLMLIASGSHFHMMQETFTSYKAPLFGRTTADMMLREIAPADLGLFLPRYSPEQVVETYSVIGGVPQYLRMWNDARPVLRNIRDTILSPVSIFRHEPVFLIQDELHEPRTYLSILEAIGPGAGRISDIADRCGLPVTHVSKYVATLAQLGFIRKLVSVDVKDASITRNSRYEIRDPYLRFHFTFVHPNQRLIEQDRIPRLAELIRGRFNAFVGKTGYEELCRRHMAQLADDEQLSFEALDVGRIWNRKVEIDVATIDHASKNALLGECRWRGRPMTVTDLKALRTKAEALPKLSGYRLHWALFSRSGFTEALRRQAEVEGVLLFEGVVGLSPRVR